MVWTLKNYKCTMCKMVCAVVLVSVLGGGVNSNFRGVTVHTLTVNRNHRI